MIAVQEYQKHPFSSITDVLPIYANKCLIILNYLDDVRHEIEGNADADLLPFESSDYKAEIDHRLEALLPMLEAMELDSAPEQVRRMTGHVEHAMPLKTLRDCAHALNELRTRVTDDLRHPALYFMDEAEHALIEDGHKKFDPVIIKKFDALYDLREASRALGFGCYTACVFHLMRAMETALREIGRQLEVTVQDANGHYLPWGKMIHNMETRLKALKKSDRKTHDHWQPVMGLLYCVKEAWRNDTMHPGAKYDDKEALAVFEAVKGFMRQLAEKV